MVLVALGGAAAARFFGNNRDDADKPAQGDHKITKFLFGAANAGDYTNAEDLVSEDFMWFVMGHKLGISDDANKGPKLLTDALHYYDENVGNSFWQLFDEVDEVDHHGNGMIAIRFVATGEFNGEATQLEMAGFLTIADNKLTEVRMVTDLSSFNTMRQAAGLPALD
jgi:hypothetical protein